MNDNNTLGDDLRERIRELEEELRCTVDLYTKALVGWGRTKTELENLRTTASDAKVNA